MDPSLAPLRRQDVCAILVTYHPDPEFPERLSRVCAQVGATIVVDNGSSAAELDMLQTSSGNLSTTLIANRDNLGVARALNIGVARATTLGFGWVLLLDQDSVVDDDMVRTLCAIHASYPERERLAVIGAGFRDGNSRAAAAQIHEPRGQWDEVESVITSGSMLPLSVYRDIGPFRDDFFIDYVDIEYCYRARAKGYRVIKTRQALMSHAIGLPTQHRLLWVRYQATNHSPDRRYYIARNDTVLLRAYGSYSWGLWALKSFTRRFRTCKRIALYESTKTRKIIAVMQGWWDGVRGNMGPRD
jgi:rhamnosyltransferase